MPEDTPNIRLQDMETRLRQETERRLFLESELAKIQRQHEDDIHHRTDLLQEIISELQREIVQRDEIERKYKQRTEILQTFIEQLQYETEEKTLVEKTLRLSEERFRMVLENAPVGICITDIHHRFEYVNPAYCRLYGYLPDDLTGTSLFDIIPSHRRQEFEAVFLQFLAGEQVLRGEWEITRSDGTLSTVLMDGVYMASVQENVPSPQKKLIIFAVDITERKQAEETLKKAQVIIDQSPAVVYQFRNLPGFPIEFVSNNINQFGYTPEDIIEGHKKPLWYIHPEDRVRVEESFVHIKKNAVEHLRREYRIICKNGESRWLEDSIIASRNEKGTIVRYQGVVVDITERKRAQEETQKALDKERELLELKARFITIASHEFRTPLTSIMLAAGILNDFGSLLTAEQTTENLLLIRESVNHMTQLMDDLLMFGRVGSASMELKITELEICGWMEDFIRRVQQTMGRTHHIKLSVPDETILYSGDETLLKQMLERLLSNAVKYSPEHSEILVSVALDQHEGCVVFSIHDEGIGILEEDLPYIFEPFHRGANIGNIGGTGMGLAILRKLVLLHHGKIEIEPKEFGATAILILPQSQIHSTIQMQQSPSFMTIE